MKFCGMVGRLAIGIKQVDFGDNLHLDPGILKEFNYLCRIGNGKGSSFWVRKYAIGPHIERIKGSLAEVDCTVVKVRGLGGSATSSQLSPLQ